MKAYLGYVFIFLVSLFFGYSGISGIIAFYNLLSERHQIATEGIVSEGEFIDFEKRGGRGFRYTAVQYKFFVEGFENSNRFSFLKEQFGEEKYHEYLDTMASVERLLNPDRPEGSWVYGEDFKNSRAENLKKGEFLEVTYLASDPDKNMAGDRRGHSFWSLLGKEWIPVTLLLLMSLTAVAMSGVILWAYAVPLFGFLADRLLYPKRSGTQRGDCLRK